MKNSSNRKKLYLRNWDYNAALILGELENIVKSNGGKLCTTWDGPKPPAYVTQRGEPCEIVNRTLNEAIEEKRDRLARVVALKRPAAIISEYKSDLEQLESIDNTPVKSYYGEWNYISFTHNNYYYYYQLDNNPFFDFYFSKHPIENGNKINRNAYTKTDDKKWWNDNFWRWGRTPDEIKKAAKFIFEMLTTAQNSRPYTDNKRNAFTTVYFMEDQKDD